MIICSLLFLRYFSHQELIDEQEPKTGIDTRKARAAASRSLHAAFYRMHNARRSACNTPYNIADSPV
jgi:hypothetical protein